MAPAGAGGTAAAAAADVVGGLLRAASSAETAVVEGLRRDLEACPFQLNGVYEADAELLDLGGDALVALNVDTLHDDSELVMASSAYDRGWLAATATLSDLAAVGAEPRALLLSCSVAAGEATRETARELTRGAADAARGQGAHLVGGDTNWAEREAITGCALGHVPRDRVLTRVGARAGDVLYMTGPVGSGNAAGVRNLMAAGGEDGSAPWRPVARCAAGRALAGEARACIDTSDGLLACAVLLADLNGAGVEIDDAEAIYDSRGLRLAARLGLPRWLLAAGEWGEYELLYAVAPGAAERRCLAALAAQGLEPRRVGRLLAEREYAFAGEGGARTDVLPLLARLREVEPGTALVDRLAQLVRELG